MTQFTLTVYQNSGVSPELFLTSEQKSHASTNRLAKFKPHFKGVRGELAPDALRSRRNKVQPSMIRETIVASCPRNAKTLARTLTKRALELPDLGF
jgi:hypothetical protein